MEEDDSLEDRTPLSPHRVAELLQLCLRSTYQGLIQGGVDRVASHPPCSPTILINVQNLGSDCTRINLRALKFQKFLGEHAPRHP